MSNARNLANLLGTSTKANQVISTSGAITTTGAFTSVGIDDNSNDTAITIDANEDVELNNGGLYVVNALNSLTVDKGGIDRTGNTTRIISGRSGGNYADMSINIAGVGGVNRQLYMDYQGNTTLDNGNLKFGTTGKGIDFSVNGGSSATGTTLGSQVLNDYEEGTWTPTLPNGGTVTVYNATYTKIGRTVKFGFYIGISGIPNNGSRFDIGGLPYDVNSTSSHYHGATSLTYVHTLNASAIGMNLGPTPWNSQPKLYFHRNDGTSSTIANSNVTGVLTQLILGGVYTTN